jgi:hypothetical protein
MNKTEALPALVALKRIESDLGSGRIDEVLARERRAELLSGVDLPPTELANVADPSAWALAFNERFRTYPSATAYAWFEQAMSAAYDTGRSQGDGEGFQRAAQLQREGFREMSEVLATIVGMIRGSTMQERMIQVDGETIKLSNHIERVLRKAGVIE